MMRKLLAALALAWAFAVAPAFAACDLTVDGPAPLKGDVFIANIDEELVCLDAAIDAAISGAQPVDSDLTAIAALTTTSFGRGLLDDADATAGRSSLGVVIGTNVQAYDAELAAWAGLTSAADTLGYFSGSGTAATTSLTSFARTILDDTTAAAVRTTIGAPAIASANTFTSTNVFQLSDDTSTAGPNLDLDRLSLTPDVADNLGSFRFLGRDSAGNSTQYGALRGVIDDATDGSEDGHFTLLTMINGSFSFRFNCGAGCWMQGATGGDPGVGKFNATELQVGGVSTGTLYAAKHLVGSLVYNPPSVNGGAFDAAQTITVTGAALGNACVASFSIDLAGMIAHCYVSATDTAIVILQNATGSPINLGNGTLRATVLK